MRIIATPAGIQPLVSPDFQADAANHERRSWLKRLGAMLGLGLLAGPAMAGTQGTRGVQRTNGQDPYIGEIMLFAGNFAPNGYLTCNGQLLQISQYSALYSILGTMYGGNGSTNFALPNLNGRAPIGIGQLAGGSTYTQGQAAGSESVTLTTNQLPAHNHPLNVSTAAGTMATPAGNVPAVATLASNEEGVNAYAAAGSLTAAATAAIGMAGGNQSVSVLSPYLALNYVIAVNGIYPSRP